MALEKSLRKTAYELIAQNKCKVKIILEYDN